MLVELHTHTTHSRMLHVPVEGLNSPEEMVRHAAGLGIGAIAITDHDQIKGALEATKYAKKYGIIVIPGTEVTTKDGHLLGIGVRELIKKGMPAEETMDAIHDSGGISIASHPFDIKGAGIKDLARKADAIEVFNAINMERLSNRYSKKFARLHKKPGVAGSDAHCVEMLGHGLNEIEAHDEDSVIAAIKKGDVGIKGKYIPVGTLMRWSVTRLKLSYPYTLDYINDNYRWHKKFVSKRMLSLVKRSPGNVDYLFKGIAYFGIGSAMVYSAGKGIAGRRSKN